MSNKKIKLEANIDINNNEKDNNIIDNKHQLKHKPDNTILFFKVFRNIFLKNKIIGFISFKAKLYVTQNNLQILKDYNHYNHNIYFERIKCKLLETEYNHTSELFDRVLLTISKYSLASLKIIKQYEEKFQEWGIGYLYESRCSNYYRELKPNELPSSLTKISLPWYDYPIVDPNIFPKDLKILNFKNYNHPLTQNSLPPCLESLCIPSFKYRIEPFTLPQTLTDLTINGYNEEFETITYGSFPNKIKKLKLVSGISGVSIFEKANTYSFDPIYGQFEEIKLFPSSLTDLYIGPRFHYHLIYKGFFPNSITKLEINSGFPLTPSSDMNWLPECLESLILVINSISIIKENTFPSTLKSLKVTLTQPSPHQYETERFISFIPDSVTNLCINGSLNLSSYNIKYPSNLKEINIKKNVFNTNLLASSTLKKVKITNSHPSPLLPSNATELVIENQQEIAIPSHISKVVFKNHVKNPLEALKTCSQSLRELQVGRLRCRIMDIYNKTNTLIIEFPNLEILSVSNVYQGISRSYQFPPSSLLQNSLRALSISKTTPKSLPITITPSNLIALNYIILSNFQIPIYPPCLIILGLKTDIAITNSTLPQFIKILIIMGPPPTINIDPIPPTLEQILIDSQYYLEYQKNNPHHSNNPNLKTLIKPVYDYKSIFFRVYNKYK
ncbi:hypothetical protein DICPUDRAFT_151519 [Dictyostelium purpureum]|uniref:FNIP repeat-containing protein n=1 Tax=Dictyostelium purpureum TaxID=5786 RepID=F0ZJ22_DICPU|nr:uncharacterized protein DICPUDRAFT_151519 [Dictyostelium purpureum]EGC36037.1 hypothetical protein DICPUDRAFT_151519 [Dictyostelium purpureum]|eukprot:XP_003287412.1 hypothetical protein DICPUDRAFT_151519 [Dictyostelium purpureum]